MPQAQSDTSFRLAEQKLTIPASGSRYPTRTRVLDALDEAHPVRVVALVAAAGYGKSTVLEQWIDRRWPPGSVAWISLDERDDDPVRFWSYLSEAVRRLGVEVDRRLVAELHEDPEAVEDLVVAVSNGLLDVGDQRLLVLDDLHRVTAEEVMGPLARLVETLPTTTTIALTTRVPLPWATTRSQARGELFTLDLSDLALGRDETEAVLRSVLGNSPGETRLERIQDRTEGWPVAIQLLAQALQRAHDPVAVLARFDGADRVVARYLLEEVLDGISPRLHRFLLDISVVETFCGDLAAAILDEPSEELIEEARAEHLFVIELDERREWLRLHHLIRDLLLAELASADPMRRELLSRRAARWFQEHGLTSPAIEQLIEGGDHGAALALVASSTATYQAEGRIRTLLALVERIPIGEIERRPAAAGSVAMALSVVGRLAEARSWLDVAERATRSEGDEVETAFAAFFVERGCGREIEALRAIERIERLADEADAVAVRDRATSMTGATKLVLALASEFLGRDDDRRSALAAVERRRSELGDIASHAVDPLVARLAADDGELDEALGRARLAIERQRQRGHAPPVLAHAHLAVAKVAWARGDLELAQASIRDANQFDLIHVPWLRTLRAVHAAEILSSMGRHDSVAEILDHAWVGERSSPTPPNSRVMVAAWGGWLASVHRQRDAAAYWWRELDLLGSSVALDDAVWARRAVHDGRADEVVDRFGPDGAGLPERPLPRVRSGLTLVAALDEIADDGARSVGQRIATLAERRGIVQPVIDDGRCVEYLVDPGGRTRVDGSASVQSAPAERVGLIDPLSPRELEVLPLLPSRMSNQEIASHLYVSLNTVKTHLKHVYRKLAVTNRDEAIERCRVLGLL